MSSATQIAIHTLCWSISWCGIAHAGLSYWFTNIEVSDNERFVLVSISDDPLEEELLHAYDEFHREEIREIRAKYRESGLYRNDGTRKPLWTYDGRWGSGHPIIAPDGEHVIFEGDWASDEYGLRAVEFTRRGKTLRSYFDTEVIPQWMLKAALNGFSPPTCSETTFNPDHMTYTMRTNQGEEIVFDAKSGNIIDIRSPFPMLYAVALVALTTIFSILVVWWRRNRRIARP